MCASALLLMQQIFTLGFVVLFITVYLGNFTPRQLKYQKIALQCVRPFYSLPYPPRLTVGGCDLG